MLLFKECNFRCLGCLRRKSERDIYAGRLDRIIGKIRELRPHKIYLGGHEPTLDPNYVEKLSELDAYIVLMTNGSLLTTNYIHELIKAGLNEVIISVKTFGNEKHMYYTGTSIEPVLNAIMELAEVDDPNFRFEVETILIPGINGPEDIERLAIFISQIDESIKLFIEPYIPSVFREPTRDELIEAVTRAMKHLYIVSYHPLHSEVQEMRKGKRRAIFIDILPRKK